MAGVAVEPVDQPGGELFEWAEQQDEPAGGRGEKAEGREVEGEKPVWRQRMRFFDEELLKKLSMEDVDLLREELRTLDGQARAELAGRQRKCSYCGERTGAALRMRVGINTGEVVVGNMGSHKRFNYTILGDAANLASRLEGANKAFGTETMVSGSTWRLASSELNGRKLADLRVVGRKTAVAVYELTGFAADAVPAGWDVFAAGLTCFREGDFAGAMKAFEQLPDDPAALSYARRCTELCAHPLTSWDGVWGLTEK